MFNMAVTMTEGDKTRLYCLLEQGLCLKEFVAVVCVCGNGIICTFVEM
jgi:hypothetical protein